MLEINGHAGSDHAAQAWQIEGVFDFTDQVHRYSQSRRMHWIFIGQYNFRFWPVAVSGCIALKRPSEAFKKTLSSF